ncbi:MAG: MucR family transcriptional regulator [Rhodopila sp.]
MTDTHTYLLTLSARIVGAHVGHNHVGTGAIPDMIRNVYRTLAMLGNGTVGGSLSNEYSPEEVKAEKPSGNNKKQTKQNNPYVHPAYGQTVFGDHLICMEDGLRMKMLKRHLQTVHGMSPEEYRAKWGLPDDYPMVANDYAKLRSNLALQSGLGLKPEDRPKKPTKTRKAGRSARG